MLAAVMGLGGLATITVGMTTESIQPATPAARTAGVAPATNAHREDTQGPVMAHSPPVFLRIPTINVETGLTSLGLNPDRSVEVPTDFGQAGWYRGGPSPGEQGPAAILGHIDSHDGPAVFYRLDQLRPNDPILVTRADGTTATFRVDALGQHPKDAFPTERVYGPTQHAALRLITCGGRFDTATRSYDDNIVVYAHLVPPE
ncbi:class F sortase [Saccharopolyspora aridisoli]|nr:class F sortase [Saccharopolyspora aridisoli]